MFAPVQSKIKTMDEERIYTESEVRAIVLVERADARYEAMREMVNLARTGEIKARNEWFKVNEKNR